MGQPSKGNPEPRATPPSDETLEGGAAGCPCRDLHVHQAASLETLLKVFLHQQPCHLQVLLLFYRLCPDSQALGTDGQDHYEDSNQERNQGPKEAVQEDSLIMSALQHHIIWPVKRKNRRGRGYKSTRHHQFIISGKHLPWKQ